MAIFGEPPAKRRRLVDDSEDVLVVNSTAVDDETLISDLMAVSPWEIITLGPPLYDAIRSTRHLLAPNAVKRMFRILTQHLECCMSWRANDTDELDDQDANGAAVQALVLCLQHTYSPGVADVCFLVLARALVFLQLQQDAEDASNALLQIIHYQITNSDHEKQDCILVLSMSQRQEFLIALLQAKSKLGTKILTLLARKDAFASIALRAVTKQSSPLTFIFPQTLLETLFEWRCHLLVTTTDAPKLSILRKVLTSETSSWLECAQAVEVVETMSSQSYSSELVDVAIEAVLQASPNVSSVAVSALQNLLDDGDRIRGCIKKVDGMVIPFLSALVRSTQEPLSTERLLPNRDVGVWAIELFWTFISFLVSGETDVPFDSQGVSELALSSLDICAGDEYKLYLAAKTICQDHWDYFFDESRRRSLIQALASILNDNESSEVSIGYTLISLQDLVGSEAEASSVVVRDRGLLDRIASLGAIACNDDASKLLFVLSDYAPNRRLLIRRPRVLIAMMRYSQLNREGEKADYFRMRVNQLAELF